MTTLIPFAIGAVCACLLARALVRESGIRFRMPTLSLDAPEYYALLFDEYKQQMVRVMTWYACVPSAFWEAKDSSHQVPWADRSGHGHHARPVIESERIDLS